uniref:Protease II n=1 Tax=uncultured Nocardioidaceae bacterium TaxID=253824 RepID=A0A6J4KYX4_9ACTN|nr:MAG: Protease II [uncultured Nocardioidaceae bacterium]
MTELTPPIAARVPHERAHHGDTFVDEYEWLRAKEDPEVISYLEAENAYTEQQTAHLAPLRQSIFDEIKSRTQETDLSVPSRKGQWWYYGRTIEGKQYGLHCRCPIGASDDWTPPDLSAEGEVAGEEILLDGNIEAEGHEFFSIGTLSVSPDGNLLAWSVDTTGAERYLMRFKDLRTGEVLPDEVPNTFPSTAWLGDGSAIFYLTVDDAWRPHQVWKHVLGTAADDDGLIFEESDDRYWVGVGSTRSDRFIAIGVSSKITSEIHVLDSAAPDAGFRAVAARREGIEYSVEHAVVAGEDRFLILHNDGGANFLLAEAPVADPSPENWRTLIPHDESTRLEDVEAFADHLVLGYRRDGLTRLAVQPLNEDGYGERREIEFDEPLFTCGTAGNPEFAQPVLRLAYTSMVTPSTVADLVVATGERFIRKQQPVLGGYDPGDYEQHRTWATAEDGTQIPVSVVSRAGTPRDGSAPCVVYGYGSYETSIDPYFSVARLSLLDRGMVYAIAHVRGGGEMGRHWYDQGKTLTKKNTFSDFVAVARHLSAEGWTSPDRLVAQGGSAGGLLMGAVANMAPDAVAGIVAQVPFVDNLTTILDPSLPLTVIEWDEWGDPLHDPEVYAYMKSYAPYENVTAQNYPPILAITSLNDTRVLYVEPAKWVARLRASGNGAPPLLKTEMVAGHGGVSGRYERWKEAAYELAWCLDVSGAVKRS